ncbi:MAG: ROK family protein [Spirochaetota bacterium]
MGAYVASDLKELNRSAVYDLLRAEGEISKAEIGRRSGISAPTVIKIVDHFVQLGLASEAGALQTALGRKPIRIRFEPESAFSIGAQYDGVHLTVGLVDLAGGIRLLRRRVVSADLAAILSLRIVDEVESLIAEAGIDRQLVRGIGVGVPGVVNRRDRSIRFAPLAGLRESFDFIPILENLGLRLGFPAFIENDANAAALGEIASRLPMVGEDLVFIEMGRGLGAGLVLDGRLRLGSRGLAGEVGYLVMEGDWKASLEEPGWLESRLDLGSFWDEVERQGMPSEASLERVSSILALALANICVALDLRLVVVGQAGDERFGPGLLARLEAAMSGLCAFEVACEAPRAAEPGVAGAAGIATEAWLERVFAGEPVLQRDKAERATARLRSK